MADNSGNNSSNTKGWRQRVGVKGSVPKISDEFRSEPRVSPLAPNRPNGGTPEIAGGQGTNGRPAPRPVAKPAPMAPRRPAPRPAPSSRPAAPPAASGPSTTPSTNKADAAGGSDFGERLRARREAAEALARKRSQETRARLSEQTASSGAPKFRFADEESNQGQPGRTAPKAPPPPRRARPAPQAPAQPAPPPAAPTGGADATHADPAAPHTPPQGSPRPPFRPMHQNHGPKPYQPSDAYRQTHGYREYDTPAAPPPDPRHSPAGTPPVEPGPGPAASPYDNGAYRSPVSGHGGYVPPQPPHAGRSAPYQDDLPDDLFDDRAAPAAPAPRRAGADDYTAAYRDYDEAFDFEEEPSKRGGIWLFVLLMVLVVAAIAAGAFWYLKNNIQPGTKAGNVPTINAPENPVKVAPKPADTTTPNAPVRRKKIYDRILGDQTLEPEKLVPTEEQPKTTPPAIQPPPETKKPVDTSPVGVQPLPLPLPPPPAVPGDQGAVSGKTEKLAMTNAKSTSSSNTSGKTAQVPTAPGSSGGNGTTITPTATNPNPGQSYNQATAGKTNANGQPAGQDQSGATPSLTLPPPPQAPTQAGSTDTSDTNNRGTAANDPQSVSPDSNLKAVPVPRKKPNAIKALARQQAAQRRLAALSRSVSPGPVAPQPSQSFNGAGPTPIVPGTAPGNAQPAPPQTSGSQNGSSGVIQNFSSGTSQPGVTAPQPKPRTNIASLPQPTRQPSTPAPQTSTGQGYVLQMSVFRTRQGADTEYRRLMSRHGGILAGLSPQIQESDLGANGKFYKLRLGSVPSRTKAARLCNALIASGEKDCLVRRR